MIKTLIKSMLKVAAFGAFIFELIGTKESKPEGNVQLHPVKLSGRTLFIREQEIFIRESYLDDKPILVLLHSWGSDSLGSWFKTIPLLQDSYSIVAIDLKNHGRTDGSWTRWDITENADMVATVLKELGIEKSILIGWSIGSAVALAVSKNYPELVSKQVLVTPFAWTVNAEYKEKPWFSIVIGLVRIRERLFPRYNSNSKYKFLRESESLRDEHSDWAWSNLNRSKDAFIYQDGSRYVVPFDARSWAHEVITPTLAVIGGNDKLVPENVSKELTDLLPDVKVKKIGGATHAIPWSHAEELSFHIKDFLVD